MPIFCFQSQDYFQPRVHGFEVGMKIEAIHPLKPSIICPATVTKSLGPYYFAVTTDYLVDVPSHTFCCHSDSPGIFPINWCIRNGVELTVPESEWEIHTCSVSPCWWGGHMVYCTCVWFFSNNWTITGCLKNIIQLFLWKNWKYSEACARDSEKCTSQAMPAEQYMSGLFDCNGIDQKLFFTKI